METNANHEFNRLLSAMLETHAAASDVLFVPGKLPQVEIHGELESPNVGEPLLTGSRIENFSRVIINGHARLQQDLAEKGACDCSYALADSCRFRVNIYKQNGQHAMVMRRLSSKVPTLDSLGLPPAFKNLTREKTGLVFVTGGTGNGKTTTLAALLNEINLTSKVHLVTELMGSSLRTREAIEMGENENRRLHDIIEAGSTGGWHSFEQSLLKAVEENLITEETAMTYSINKPAMRQRLDFSKSKHTPRTAKPATALPMMVVEAAEMLPVPPVPPIVAPVIKPEPSPKFLKGVLNGFM